MRFLAVTNFTFMIISVCDLRHSRRAVDGPSWSGRSVLLWFEVVRITAFTLVDMKDTERGCTDWFISVENEAPHYLSGIEIAYTVGRPVADLCQGREAGSQRNFICQ